MRTRECTPATISGRRAKALQFQVAADTIALDGSLGDAFVTNCVHAGIAASDVICCRRLGIHAAGQDHQDAVRLLATAGPDGRELSVHLRTLLGMKSSAGYDSVASSRDDCRRAARAMAALVAAMESIR
jgi:hypothetical protein